MRKNFSVSLSLDDTKRLRAMSAELGVTRSLVVSAAYALAAKLMGTGEYSPLAFKDYPGQSSTVYTDVDIIKDLKRMCLTSDLKYTAGSGRQRRITAGKVVRDVLHCIFDLHEAGVKLNLEVDSGK